MNLICGINPVLEALAAGTRHFDRLLVVKGLRNRRISDAIRRATQLGIPLRFETRETLDRMAGGVPHQGLIAVVSREAGPVARGPPGAGPRARPSSWSSTASRTPATSAPSCAPPRRRAPTASSCPSGTARGSPRPSAAPPPARSSTSRSARVGNLAQALEALKARGFWVVGFDAAGTERWDAVDLAPPGGPRARRRGPRHPAPGARALRPPRLDPALRPRRLAQRLGGGGHRALRGRAPARRGAEPRAAHSHAPRDVPADRRPRAGRPETDPGARPRPPPDDHGRRRRRRRDARAGDPVDLHEDVAWGQGPTVLKPAGSSACAATTGGAARSAGRRPEATAARRARSRARAPRRRTAPRHPGPGERRKERGRRRRGRRGDGRARRRPPRGPRRRGPSGAPPAEGRPQGEGQPPGLAGGPASGRRAAPVAAAAVAVVAEAGAPARAGTCLHRLHPLC